MRVLIPVDGSQSAKLAARHAAEQQTTRSAVLLYVAASARPGDLGKAQFTLRGLRDECHQINPELDVSTRIEVGARDEVLCRIATKEAFDLIVIGAQGINAEGHTELVDSEIDDMVASLQPPVVVVTSLGEYAPADSERVADARTGEAA